MATTKVLILSKQVLFYSDLLVFSLKVLISRSIWNHESSNQLALHFPERNAMPCFTGWKSSMIGALLRRKMCLMPWMGSVRIYMEFPARHKNQWEVWRAAHCLNSTSLSITIWKCLIYSAVLYLLCYNNESYEDIKANQRLLSEATCLCRGLAFDLIHHYYWPSIKTSRIYCSHGIVSCKTDNNMASQQRIEKLRPYLDLEQLKVSIME